jgi:hypothetical protein
MANLGFLLDRSTIAALAITGAVLALIASLLLRRATATRAGAARLLLRSGYAITWVSIALFIIAGFVSNR